MSDYSFSKAMRLSRIINPETGRTVITPLDDSLLSGPEGGLHNLAATTKQAVAGGANAILGFRGLFTHSGHLVPANVGRIVNLTASTTGPQHTRKVKIGTIEDALALGADAIAVHVNFTSRWEPEMLEILGHTAIECEKFALPLIALMYPRTEGPNGTDYNSLDIRTDNPDQYAKLVRHATRIGVELGASLIKTIYTGSIDSFRTVTESAMGVPVVIAGEAQATPRRLLEKVHAAMQAGAAGVAGGRHVSNSGHVTEMVAALGDVVHHGLSAQQALDNHPALIADNPPAPELTNRPR
jgi:DhnA family fructose-bisphosphate aldolase class Ia